MGIDLLAEARKDAARIMQTDFATDITLTTPDGNTTVTVKGLASKHNFSIDPETGLPVNSKNTHISISESVLVSSSYPVRGANNEVQLYRHRVTYTDSAGITATYEVNENWPDETLGLIVMQLGDVEV